MSKKPISGPHVVAVSRVDDIMRKVIIALLPATGLGVLLFGWPALFLCAVTVLSALAWEAIALKMKGVDVKPFLNDGSAVLTGLLVAMTLPPWAPWWIGVLGSGIAMMLGKHVYGGLGQNPFNPAMLARVALLVAFPIEMTTWVNVKPLLFGPGVLDSLSITFSNLHTLDAITGATTLGAVKTGFSLNQTLPGLLYGLHRLGARQPGRNIQSAPAAGWHVVAAPWRDSVAYPGFAAGHLSLAGNGVSLDRCRALSRAVGASEFRCGDAGSVLHSHRLRHLAEYATGPDDFRRRLRPVDLRHSLLGRLPGRHRLCGVVDERGDAVDRPLRQTAHLWSLP